MDLCPPPPHTLRGVCAAPRISTFRFLPPYRCRFTTYALRTHTHTGNASRPALAHTAHCSLPGQALRCTHLPTHTTTCTLYLTFCFLDPCRMLPACTRTPATHTHHAFTHQHLYLHAHFFPTPTHTLVVYYAHTHFTRHTARTLPALHIFAIPPPALLRPLLPLHAPAAHFLPLCLPSYMWWYG